MESTAMAVGFGRQGLLKEYNFVNAAIVVINTDCRIRISDVDW